MRTVCTALCILRFNNRPLKYYSMLLGNILYNTQQPTNLSYLINITNKNIISVFRYLMSTIFFTVYSLFPINTPT